MSFLEGPWLDTAGRALFIGYFLIPGLCNLSAHQVCSHIDRMRDLGTPLPAVAFWTGLAIQFTGCALLLTERFAAAGALCLLLRPRPKWHSPYCPRRAGEGSAICS